MPLPPETYGAYDQRLVTYYSRRAPEYEQIYYRDDPERQAELAAESARLVELTRGKEVLDLACGTGYWLERIASSAAGVIATDVAGPMLAQARRQNLVCPVDFVRADLRWPPFAAGSFDVVSLGFWFSHHPKQDYGELFDGLTRLLRPSGRVWMIDNNPSAEGRTHDPVGFDGEGNKYIRRRLDNGEEHVILKNYFSEGDLRDIFSARFEIVRVTYGKHYWSVELAVG